MLSLHLAKGEYITINDDVIVQVFPDGGHTLLRVEAPREIPILRGDLREKQGRERPEAVRATEARGQRSRKSPSDQLRSQRYFEKARLCQERRADAVKAGAEMKRLLGRVECPETRRALGEQLERFARLSAQ